MLTHWNKLLNTNCNVFELGSNYVYPIMRNASSSLRSIVGKKYTNEEIKECKDIVVFIREPGERFVSGINEYCRQNNADLSHIYQLVEQGKFIDRHFSPQWIWLLHLNKFYKSNIILKSIEDVGMYCKVHVHPSKGNDTNVVPLANCVNQDKELYKHVGQTVDISTMVRKCKNVLS